MYETESVINLLEATIQIEASCQLILWCGMVLILISNYSNFLLTPLKMSQIGNIRFKITNSRIKYSIPPLLATPISFLKLSNLSFERLFKNFQAPLIVAGLIVWEGWLPYGPHMGKLGIKMTILKLITFTTDNQLS